MLWWSFSTFIHLKRYGMYYYCMFLGVVCNKWGLHTTPWGKKGRYCQVIARAAENSLNLVGCCPISCSLGCRNRLKLLSKLLLFWCRYQIIIIIKASFVLVQIPNYYYYQSFLCSGADTKLLLLSKLPLFWCR